MDPALRRLLLRRLTDRSDLETHRSDLGPCFIWTRTVDRKGYGLIKIKGRTKRVARVAYATLVGPIPPGQHVLHHCDVRRCWRPEHLWPGTNADNVADMMRKGRSVGRKPGRSGRRALQK